MLLNKKLQAQGASGACLRSSTQYFSAFQFPFFNKFGFSSKNSESSEQGGEGRSNAHVGVVEDSRAQKGGSSSGGSEVSAIYRLIPVADHPLFPGSSTALSVTLEQFQELRNADMVFASVVKNEKLLMSTQDVVQTLRQQGQGPTGLPKITSLEDVFRIGVYCHAKVKEDPQNPFAPYMLTIFPVQKGKIVEALDKVAPLARIRAVELIEEKITEEQLDVAQSVVYKYLKQQYMRCYKISPDQKFVAYLQFLETNFRIEYVQDFIHMLLTCVSLPQYINTYKFLINISRHQVQEIFEESDLTQRLEKMNTVFTDFVNKLEIWNKLEEQYDFRSDQQKTQKKLEEIYESLKKHFSTEKDEKQEQVQEFLKNLEGKAVPDHIMKVINEEIKRFLSMEKHHSEVQVTRTYLEYLTKMPYGVSTQENFDIRLAKQILDQTHYGMEDVKKRILEFIAVGKMKNSVHGKILCFVGPPGVGKTSIGESIARSLGRKFHRIALGGDKDTSTLKGFRRTYVGAIPGKIVRALRTVEVENPVILIDEVDKIGQRSLYGDPGSALLEILDPEQNSAFTDDFLDIPIDLSKVLFLCTANILDTLHPALLDRMEIINVAGYTHKEKRHILDKYLLPDALKNAGLENGTHNFTITDGVRDYIIQNYAREAGVRSLKKFINKIAERIAYTIVDQESDQEVVVDVNTIEKFIGHPIFKSSKFYQESTLTPPGVVIGLAYNEYGGSVLYVESTQSSYSSEGRGELKVTGSLGDVMKESSMIAQTYAKNFLNTHFKDNEAARRYLETHNIHIHFPEGAVKKDGPSAGITITTAMVSLALGKQVPQDIAMTGEISLNGKVLAIGGVKEKTMAATREGIKKLIFPKANQKDVEELQDYIKEGIEFHFVQDYSDVFKVLFPDTPISK